MISQFHGKQHTINKTTLTTDCTLSVDNTLHTILTVLTVTLSIKFMVSYGDNYTDDHVYSNTLVQLEC